MLDLPTLFFTLGSMPLFASRTFSTSFWIAFCVRMQAEGLLLSESLGPFQIDLVSRLPSWAISDGTLFILLLLALAETAVDKSPELRLMLAEFEPAARATWNFMVNNVALAVSTTALASVAVHQAAIHQAGIGAAIFALLPAGGVYAVGVLRRNVLNFLTDLDEDDDVGLRKLISWAEDGWVGFGAFFLIVMPLLALTIAGLSVAVLWLVQRWLEAREEKLRVPCAQCGERILPTAPACPNCKATVDQPMAVGALGQPTTMPVADIQEHRLRLLSKKRCLVCATRLRRKSLRQTCTACGSEMIPSLAWAESYLTHVEKQLPKTLMICFGFSLVPLFGLIPGVIYYRLSLISALRGYVPPTMGCMARWVVRMINLLLLAFQWVPFLGALTLPAMCYLNYVVYRRVLLGQTRTSFLPEGASVGAR